MTVSITEKTSRETTVIENVEYVEQFEDVIQVVCADIIIVFKKDNILDFNVSL